MCDDVLSCATVESNADCANPLYAAVPTAPRAAARAVKPDGTSTNRTADAGSAARKQTTRSSPAGHRKIFPKSRLGADPRAGLGKPLPQRPLPPPAARASVADSDNSDADGTPGPLPSSARPGRHAKRATAPPPADTPDCNTAPTATEAQRTARIPSAGSGAASAPDKSLVSDEIVDHAQEDPRERQLPKVKSRGGATLLSETHYARCLIPRPPSASE
jgi:hypothetical protein